MGNVLKKIRDEQCLSQEELAETSQISIKTIQRIENGKSAGSAYTIKQLALALKVDPVDLRAQNMITDEEDARGKRVLKLMNWSAIVVILLPLSNIIIPAFIYFKNKKQLDFKSIGKKIITVQILWTIGACVAMVLVPLLCMLLMGDAYAGSVPMWVPVYYVAALVNVGIIIRIAYFLSNKDEDDYWLPNLL